VGTTGNRSEALTVLRRAVELGVNLIDTADAYGPGISERLIADALHPYPDDLVIATKGGRTRQGPYQWSTDCRPMSLRRACERSLRRLRVEQIDLYQLHAVDARVSVEESIGALAELQAEGKVRHIGVCNVNLEQLSRATGGACLVAATFSRDASHSQHDLSSASRGEHRSARFTPDRRGDGWAGALPPVRARKTAPEPSARPPPGGGSSGRFAPVASIEVSADH
jgi:aryl-alcohol dehydrogenase-like predicted oxidoreductase